MGTVTIEPQSRSRALLVAGGKPILRGIHHLALVTDNMRMTLDFYVRVLGMPIVHGLRTPSRPAGASHSHGNGAPPHAFSRHGRRQFAASLNIRKPLPRLTATRLARYDSLKPISSLRQRMLEDRSLRRFTARYA